MNADGEALGAGPPWHELAPADDDWPAGQLVHALAALPE
jgi:hypothetical protein